MITSRALPSPAELREGPTAAFRSDVVRGLRSSPKELPCKYFYDANGSQLFDRVCDIDEYYLTRTELAIMEEHAEDMARLMGDGCLLIEYGSGSSIKTRLLLDHISEPAGYVPVDISGNHLRESARRLSKLYAHVEVRPVWADFTRPFEIPMVQCSAKRRVVYFPGSTLGNFTPDDSIALLRQAARRVGRNGAMLLGVDLKKDPAIITAAYNDSAGVSAQFNLNLLVRINRELGADFEIDKFWHHAFYQPVEGRMEMHLVSQQDQFVRLDDEEFQFGDGESICTEYSYKYSLRDIDALAESGGFELGEMWVDERRYFAVCFLRVR